MDDFVFSQFYRWHRLSLNNMPIQVMAIQYWDLHTTKQSNAWCWHFPKSEERGGLGGDIQTISIISNKIGFEWVKHILPQQSKCKTWQHHSKMELRRIFGWNGIAVDNYKSLFINHSRWSGYRCRILENKNPSELFELSFNIVKHHHHRLVLNAMGVKNMQSGPDYPLKPQLLSSMIYQDLYILPFGDDIRIFIYMHNMFS